MKKNKMKYIKINTVKNNNLNEASMDDINNMSDEDFETFLNSGEKNNKSKKAPITKKNPIYSTDDKSTKNDDDRYADFWKKHLEEKDKEEEEYQKNSKNISYRSDSITKDFKDMSLMEKFIDMTKYTYILGQEDELLYIFPSNIEQDSIGNYFMKIGESDTMFTSHLDTATSKKVKVNHLIENEEDTEKQTFISTDGRTILGADDKAGVLIMLHMIENNIPGLYYFFIGEEKGTVGSSGIYNESPELFKDYKKCIAFDRRGYGSIITKQYGSTCCSSEFATALAQEMNKAIGTKFQEDPTGIYTDSAVFMDIIPEVTNISVGYFNEHSGQEFQNMSYLEWLCDGVLKVDWESLPIKRNPMEENYKLPKHKKNDKKISTPRIDDTYQKLFDIVEEVMADVFNMECLNGHAFQPEKEMIFEDWANEENVLTVYIHENQAITIGKDYFLDLQELKQEMKEYYGYDISRIEQFYGEEDEEDEDEEDEDYGDMLDKNTKKFIGELDENDFEENFEDGISVKYFIEDVKIDLLKGKSYGHITASDMDELLSDYGKTIESLIVWLYHNGNNPKKTYGLMWDADKKDFYFDEVK